MTFVEILNTALIILASVILTVAAVSDYKYRKIPNFISIALALTFVVFAATQFLTEKMAVSDIGTNVGIAGIVFMVTFIMFTVNVFGGGDAKLLSALSLFAGSDFIYPLLFWIALSGGLVAVGQLIAQKMRTTKHTGKVPYGIAISASGLWMLAELYTAS